ncbi:MerR family transcriptional regulator [Alteromonas facilis]|uniref:MerR family transcriptional regulator n=1 Tax=Alteromonas facilis TaxID=2048004 RepID=UPI000C290D39|nr:MerR family transcriptional regulator [Alteromonas facilis]
MRIGELAKNVGIETSTIRYYESIGLLPEVRRTASGYRIYSEESVARIKLIKLAQTLGFKLDELAQLWREGDTTLSSAQHDDIIASLKRQRLAISQSISTLNQQHEQINALINLLGTTWASGHCANFDDIEQILTLKKKHS